MKKIYSIEIDSFKRKIRKIDLAGHLMDDKWGLVNT